MRRRRLRLGPEYDGLPPFKKKINTEVDLLAITEVVGVKICCGGYPRLSFYYDERVNLPNLAVGLGAALTLLL